MRNAPSVMYPVGRCRFHAGVLLVLGALALAVLLRWGWPWLPVQAARPGSWAVGGVGALLWLLWAAGAWVGWRRARGGQLHWDAQAASPTEAGAGLWRWRTGAHDDGVPLARVQAILDLQRLALLRLHPLQGPGRWIWVEAGRDPARWNDLRRALRATAG
jgi:hypothetical protein